MSECKKKTFSKGVTLIELMIVVVIIGILATIAYPAYTKQVKASRRSDAYNALTVLANDMERFRSDCGQYPALIVGAKACGGALGRSHDRSPESYYQLSVEVAGGGVPPGGYLIRASAQGAQATDVDCVTLTLSSTGATSATAGVGGDATKCWRK